MNATVGPSEARTAKEGASADSAEDKEGYRGCKPVEASCCSHANNSTHIQEVAGSSPVATTIESLAILAPDLCFQNV